MSSTDIQDLQVKISFLERHIEEQDRVIFALQNRTQRMEKSLERLNERVANSGSDADAPPADEKPPHY